MSRFFLIAWVALCAAVGPARGAEPDRTLYSSDQLVADITAQLSQHFRCDGDLSIDLLRPWAPPTRSAVHWDFAISEYPGLAAVNMLLRIRLKADGVLVDDSSLMVHAALMRDVWYSRNPISAGTTFSRSLLEARRTDVLALRDTLAAKDGDDSFVISHEISAEHMLTWHDVGRRPLIHRGQVVEVIAAEGRLVLKMKALAMENGAQGDLVTVRNLDTRKDISAVVVGDQKVEVHF